MKLKEINLDQIEYSPKKLLDSEIINITYLNSELIFQTPKVIINKINKEYIFVYVSESFKEKILSLESHYSKKYRIKSLLQGNSLKIKVGSTPKVIKNNDYYYYYNLKVNDPINLLLHNKCIWNNNGEYYYNLTVKEILVH